MGELQRLGNVLSVPRPQEGAAPRETEHEDRHRTLREAVWNKVPKHLARFSYAPEFEPLVSNYDRRLSYALIGPTGCGKSAACVNLVRELLRKGRDNGGRDFEFAKGIFWTRVDSLTAAGGRDDESAEKLLHRAEFSRLMIVDDLGSPSKTMLRILQLRYDTQRPVIVTNGSLNPTQFMNSVGGEAVARWFLECGEARGKLLIGKKART